MPLVLAKTSTTDIRLNEAILDKRAPWSSDVEPSNLVPDQFNSDKTCKRGIQPSNLMPDGSTERLGGARRDVPG